MEAPGSWWQRPSIRLVYFDPFVNDFAKFGEHRLFVISVTTPS